VTAGLAKLSPQQVSRLQVKWAFGFDGDISAFAQPTIIDGQVFVGSAGGLVHALRADTGCLQWVYRANGPIRSAIVIARVGSRPVALFGDLTGWFYALDATSGQEIWKKRPEQHEAVRLSGAPMLYKDTILIPVSSWEESRALNTEYACCTFRGSITALHIRDGSEAWKTYTISRKPELTGKSPLGNPMYGPSGAPVWSSPTLDTKRRLLYITTGNNLSPPATDTSDAVMALDPLNGRVVWSTQTTHEDVFNSNCGLTPRNPNCPQDGGPDFDFGAAAMLVKTAAGRELLVAGQKSGVITAFDPDRKGAIVWQTRVGHGGVLGGIEWGMASDGNHIYAGISDAVLIRGAMTRTLDPQFGGGLTSLNSDDGSQVWHAPPIPCGEHPKCSPAQPAALTVIPGVVFSGSLDGHLRAYSAGDGKVIWDLDTVRDYDTINGIKAKGGAIDGPGAIVVGGMVFVNSGYTRLGGMPGNVLLALAPGP
jgi:polyvinyl alcohol dehydrogenase (cytochrome)